VRVRSYWLAIHVSAHRRDGSSWSVRATVLYLVRDGGTVVRRPATDPFRHPRRRFPSPGARPGRLRNGAFGFHLDFRIIAGAIWRGRLGRYWGWDRETWAFIAWVVYAAYLHARSTAGWRG